MRLLVLTTDTPHHTYFVRELAKVYPELHVICETTGVTPAFDVHHPFEDERDQYERAAWFGGRCIVLRDVAETSVCQNINHPDAVAHVSKLRSQATVVFGTRKLSRTTIVAAAGAPLMNLHGGDPEHYRGLDTHLWAIYHNDYANLVTTLHTVNEVLDDGEIIAVRPIPLERNMRLHQLRMRNTECALRLTLDALEGLRQSGDIARRLQRQVGRYYSWMPAVLKAVCVSKFERYCADLA